MEKNENIIITKINSEHARKIATLHIEGIDKGFISSLGFDFVSSLYEVIAQDKNSFGFAALEADNVVGFVAFSGNLSLLYRNVARHNGLKMALILARRMFSLQVIKKVIDNLFYPSRMKKLDLPDAELLSIAVSPKARGRGLAALLLRKGLDECARRGIEKVKVLVAADNERANRLYSRCGLSLAGKVSSHGVVSNIYVARTCSSD